MAKPKPEEKKTIQHHLEAIPSRKELSISPSHHNLSYDSNSQSPIGANNRSVNAASLGAKKSSVQQSLLINQNSVVNKASPSYRRIVNIYSINPNNKKKKFHLNPPSGSTSANNQGNHSVIYRGEDVRARIQQLREEIAEDRSHSLDNKHAVRTGSNVNLPELKSVTPNITNVKHYYEVINNGSSSLGSQAKMMGKKKSYERLVRLDQQLYHLYRQSGRKMDSIQPIRAQGQLKNRPSLGIYYGYHGNNKSINGELDIQGRSMVNSKIVNNSYI